MDENNFEDLNMNMEEQPQEQKPRNGFAVASLVMGILSFVNFFGLEKAIAAIVFGYLSLKQFRQQEKTTSKRFANAGIILGVIAILLTIVFIVKYLPRIRQEMMQMQRTKSEQAVTPQSDSSPQEVLPEIKTY